MLNLIPRTKDTHQSEVERQTDLFCVDRGAQILYFTSKIEKAFKLLQFKKQCRHTLVKMKLMKIWKFQMWKRLT